MKNLRILAIALAVAFGLVAAVFTVTKLVTRSHAHNHTTTSAVCCSDATCCSNGSCQMNGACCSSNHGEHNAVDQIAAVTKEKSSCCGDAACCSDGNCKMGGSCCGNHAAHKTQNARLASTGVIIENAGGASCHHTQDNQAQAAKNSGSSCCGSGAACCPNGACCAQKAVQASL